MQGLRLGDVHFFWAEEHLHQVICLHPVLQQKTISQQATLPPSPSL